MITSIKGRVMITFIFIIPVMRKELTLSRLRSASQVVYNRKSVQLADKVKKLFTLSQNREAFQDLEDFLQNLDFSVFIFGMHIFERYHFIPLLPS